MKYTYVFNKEHYTNITRRYWNLRGDQEFVYYCEPKVTRFELDMIN